MDEVIQLMLLLFPAYLLLAQLWNPSQHLLQRLETVPIKLYNSALATDEAAHENAKSSHDNEKHVTWFVPEG